MNVIYTLTNPDSALDDEETDTDDRATQNKTVTRIAQLMDLKMTTQSSRLMSQTVYNFHHSQLTRSQAAFKTDV